MKVLARFSVVVLGLAACSHKGGPPVELGSAGASGSSAGGSAASAGSGSAVSAVPAIPAEARARTFLQQQVDAVQKHDHPALEGSFAPKAIVIDMTGSLPIDEAEIKLDPGDKIGKLVAGGTADAVWFYAEVGRLRIAELIVAAESWHAVAGSFVETKSIEALGGNVSIHGGNGPGGPLAKLAISTSATAAQLAPDAIAIGPKSVATGAAARDALSALKLDPMTQFEQAREVTTPTWGFVQVNVDHPEGKQNYVDRITVQLFAVPNPDKSWKVVLVQYWPQ